MNNREIIEEYYPESELLFADGFDAAIIGVCSVAARVVYSKSKIIEILMVDMSYDEAIEYFDFNIAGAYVGISTPIYVDDEMFLLYLEG